MLSCSRCGGKHDSESCWAKNKNCFKCGKKGHTKVKCRKDQEKVKLVSVESESEGEDPTDHMYNLRSKVRTPPIMVEVGIGGKQLMFELDTGSPYTFMSRDCVQSVFEQYELKESKVDIKSFTGHTVDVLGMLETQVTYQGRTAEAQLLVTAHSPNLLGRDLLANLKVLAVNSISEGKPLEEILAQHQALFKDELGKMKGFQAKIHVDKDAPPIFCKARPIPFALRAKVEKEIERLLEEKVIEPVKHSEWAAPVVPVLKSSGEVRLCGDYKMTINKRSKLEQYPIPSLEDLTTKLSNGSVFYKLDLSHAYNQIELDAQSRQFVTINTHKGLFQYTRLPYGVSSAPAVFQRAMESVVQGIPSVAVYFDDILVTGETVSQSLENLEAVLSRLDDAGLRLKKEKCQFMAHEITYLGHRISQAGIKPVGEKVQALVDAKVPGNDTELKAYLGLLNYYGKFLQGLSQKLHPLHRLLQNGVKWQWGAEQQECFEKTKNMILSARVLVHYDPSKALILQCDASQYGLGAVLSQVMDDGQEHPVGFTSRTLNAAEKNYSQLDKEGAAVIFGLKKFHKYLYGRHFTIVTDHKPLLSLFHQEKQVPPIASPRIQRWAVILRAYEYTMQYKPGKENTNADCLSRLPLNVTVKEGPEDRVLMIDELQGVSTLTAQNIADWSRHDPVLANVQEFLLRGWPEDTGPEFAPYRQRKDELSVQDGCILWGSRVVIPPNGRQQVVRELHTAHPGINRMKALARSYIWWPQIDADLEDAVRKCTVCQESQRSPPLAPLHPWEYPDAPWKRIHVDFAGPVDNHMLLVVVDAFSKWIEVYITKSSSSAATIAKLRECFAQHGIPDVVVSDNGSNFTSEEFADFVRKNGIAHLTTAPYHPSSNGLAERAVQTVKNGIRKTDGDSLHTKLYRFLLQYRITPQTTTGKSPSELLFHRRLKTRLDLLHPNLMGKVQKRQLKMKEHHDNNFSGRQLSVGDHVSARNFGHGPKWVSGTVTKVNGPLSYEVQLTHGQIVRRHVDHLMKRVADSQGATPHAVNHSQLPVHTPQQTAFPRELSPTINPAEHQQGETPTTEVPTEDSVSTSEQSTDAAVTMSSEQSSASGRYPSRARNPPSYLKDFVCHLWDSTMNILKKYT